MLKLLTGETATHQWLTCFLSFLPLRTENIALLKLTSSLFRSHSSILSTCIARPFQCLPQRPSPTWSPSTLAKPPFFFLCWRDIFASCNQTTRHPGTENNRNNTVTLLNYITCEHCPANTLVDWNSNVQASTLLCGAQHCPLCLTSNAAPSPFSVGEWAQPTPGQHSSA